MKRSPGRPPLDAASRSEAVCVKLPAVIYDKADRLANRNRESLPDMIRRGLKRLIDEERG